MSYTALVPRTCSSTLRCRKLEANNLYFCFGEMKIASRSRSAAGGIPRIKVNFYRGLLRWSLETARGKKPQNYLAWKAAKRRAFPPGHCSSPQVHSGNSSHPGIRFWTYSHLIWHPYVVIRPKAKWSFVLHYSREFDRGIIYVYLHYSTFYSQKF